MRGETGMERCGCYLGGKQIGEMQWKKDGQQLMTEMQCPFEAGYIYRAILEHQAGELPLGVMLPEHGQFVLRRQIATTIQPKAVYIDRTLPGEEHLPGLPVAWSAFAGDEHSISAIWKDIEYIIIPLQADKDHACGHLLCLATPLEHQGALYGILCRQEGKYTAVSDSLRNPSVVW